MCALDHSAGRLLDVLEQVTGGVHLMSDPELLTHGPDVVEALEATARALPPMDTRSRVEAFTVEGRTPRQIADLLGVSTQAVYQHLKRVGQ